MALLLSFALGASSEVRPSCEAQWSARAVSPVVGIVTGVQHTGSTVMAWLIKNLPEAFSGFECGFLVGESPAAFEGSYWAQRMEHPTNFMHMWNVSAAGMRRLYDAPCFVDMYERLLEVDGYLRAMPAARVLDKTPEYVHRLPAVLKRAPGVPCVVMTKHNARTKSHEAALRDSTLRPRIFEVKYEDFVREPMAVMRRVVRFLKLDENSWTEAFLRNGTGLKEKLRPFLGQHTASKFAKSVSFNADGGKCDKTVVKKSHGKLCHHDLAYAALPGSNWSPGV